MCVPLAPFELQPSPHPRKAQSPTVAVLTMPWPAWGSLGPLSLPVTPQETPSGAALLACVRLFITGRPEIRQAAPHLQHNCTNNTHTSTHTHRLWWLKPGKVQEKKESGERKPVVIYLPQASRRLAGAREPLEAAKRRVQAHLSCRFHSWLGGTGCLLVLVRTFRPISLAPKHEPPTMKPQETDSLPAICILPLAIATPCGREFYR